MKASTMKNLHEIYLVVIKDYPNLNVFDSEPEVISSFLQRECFCPLVECYPEEYHPDYYGCFYSLLKNERPISFVLGEDIEDFDEGFKFIKEEMMEMEIMNEKAKDTLKKLIKILKL